MSTVYFAVLVMGGGWRSLLPRRTGLLYTRSVMLFGTTRLPLAKILIRRKWLHPFSAQSNKTRSRRAAYSLSSSRRCLYAPTAERFTNHAVLLAGCAFGGMTSARVCHFWLNVLFIFFVVPHVFWFSSMGWDKRCAHDTIGWSTTSERSEFTRMNNEE